MGGGVSFDGLKQKVNGTKYYDFFVHYFEVQGHVSNFLTVEAILRTRVLFLVACTGPKSASSLRATLDQKFLSSVGLSLDSFLLHLTFVTDFAAAIPCIVGSSV